MVGGGGPINGLPPGITGATLAEVGGGGPTLGLAGGKGLEAFFSGVGTVGAVPIFCPKAEAFIELPFEVIGG